MGVGFSLTDARTPDLLERRDVVQGGELDERGEVVEPRHHVLPLEKGFLGRSPRAGGKIGRKNTQ